MYASHSSASPQRSGSVIPLIGDLTLVNPGDELCRGDSVFSFFSPEIGNFDQLMFEHDFGICQNLLSHLRGHVLCRLIDDNVLVLRNDIASCSRPPATGLLGASAILKCL